MSYSHQIYVRINKKKHGFWPIWRCYCFSKLLFGRFCQESHLHIAVKTLKINSISHRKNAIFFLVDSNINLMWKWYGRVKISNFLVLGVTGTQNGPLLAKKWLFWAQKKISYIFSESSFQNLMFDTKTNLLSFVDAKIWSFKN